jgi:hypothetical protein
MAAQAPFDVEAARVDDVLDPGARMLPLMFCGLL